jgi:hypothetical protein
MKNLKYRYIFGFLFVASLVHSSVALALDPVTERVLEQGELAPLPEVKPLLVELANLIDSPNFKKSIEASRTLTMMRERLRTSLFHLNLQFNVVVEKYPYDPPFKEPFPFRPSLEAIDEAIRFLSVVEDFNGQPQVLRQKLEQVPYFESLKKLFPAVIPQSSPKAISIRQMTAMPVEAYETFQERLERYGEVASFPEYETTVRSWIADLQSKEFMDWAAQDKAFAKFREEALSELQKVISAGSNSTRLHANATAAFPYRRTIQAIEKAVMVADLKERLKYEEGINWHEIELSWYKGDKPKVLGLYHFNRYKYQMAGLLADPEMVLLPSAESITIETLIRLRAAPLGIMDAKSSTSRLDRHHNTPTDAFFHDANHVRRMWGYDKRKAQRRGANTKKQRLEIYREQDAFTKDLLARTAPETGLEKSELEVRKMVRVLFFETNHETALTPDRDSLLYDLLRRPATPQPFEVQTRAVIANLEDIRTFDGNLKSGADQLSLNLESPTVVRYFYDRAPGYLANIDNKLRWGFYDSAFAMQVQELASPEYRTPVMVAEGAERLFGILNHPSPPRSELTAQIVDRSGQPELWNYFSIRDSKAVTVSGIDVLNTVAADEIHANWRRNSAHIERWKPTNAKLKDGTHVNTPNTLALYLDEQGIPEFARAYFKLDKDPVTGEMVLFEDLKNLPNKWLAHNHKNENMMSGATAVSVVDRIWHNEIRFKSPDDVERWLVAAAQTVHQAVLDRNANGARNNPQYNAHWLNLPPNAKMNDLDLVRIAFEARLRASNGDLPKDQADMFLEGLMRLYGKIRAGQPLRTCRPSLARLLQVI